MKTTSKILLIGLIGAFICIIVVLRPYNAPSIELHNNDELLVINSDSTTTPISINVNNIAIHGNTGYQYLRCKARIICSDTATSKITIPNVIKKYIEIKEAADSLIITSNLPMDDGEPKMRSIIEESCIHIFTKKPNYVFNESKINITVCDLQTDTFAISGADIDFNNCKIDRLNCIYGNNSSFYRTDIGSISTFETPELWGIYSVNY